MCRLVAQGVCDISKYSFEGLPYFAVFCCNIAGGKAFEVPLEDVCRCYRNLGNIAVSGSGQIGKEESGGSWGSVRDSANRSGDAAHDTGVEISIKEPACPPLVW